jgi:predicted nucleic acid-binding Zn ribbon protein
VPVYESYCRSCHSIKEWYAKHFTDVAENPFCDCGEPMVRVASRFGVVFSGTITTKYNDNRGVDSAHQEGHWAYRVKSSKSGHPEPVFIETFQQQREFCKEEGLVNPKDLPNMEADSEGKFRSNAGMGMPGVWV